MSVTTRQAGRVDLGKVGHLRWLFDHEDAERTAPQERDQFIAAFMERSDDDFVHWLAEVDGEAAAVMTVRKVKKVPKIGELDGYWGYLTNTYTMPEHRNQGVGTKLLSAVTEWAQHEQLELLVVWPSERAFAFYERGGFRRRDDPLVLEF